MPKLLLTLENTQFYPGSIVRGFVEISSRNELWFQGVRIELLGTETFSVDATTVTVVKASDADIAKHTAGEFAEALLPALAEGLVSVLTDFDTGGSGGGQNIIKNSKEILNLSQKLFPNAQEECQLPAGSIRLDFEFKLPEELPSNMKISGIAQSAKVQYLIKAKLFARRKKTSVLDENVSCEKPFTITQPVCQHLQSELNQINNFEETITSKGGNVIIRGSMPKCVRVGGTATLTVEIINNASTIQVGSFQLLYNCHVKGVYKKLNVEGDIFGICWKEKIPTIKKGSSKKLSVQLKVPEDCPDEFTSVLISTTYQVFPESFQRRFFTSLNFLVA
jgi:hypothetical protein